MNNFIAIDGRGRFFIVPVTNSDVAEVTGSHKRFMTIKDIGRLDKYVEKLQPEVIYMSKTYACNRYEVMDVIEKHSIVPLSQSISASSYRHFNVSAEGRLERDFIGNTVRLIEHDAEIMYEQAMTVLGSTGQKRLMELQLISRVINKTQLIHRNDGTRPSIDVHFSIDGEVAVNSSNNGSLYEYDKQYGSSIFRTESAHTDKLNKYGTDGILALEALNRRLRDNMAITGVGIDIDEMARSIDITYRSTGNDKDDSAYIRSVLKEFA